ncbi:Nucleotide exchange factor [Nesidiocoris tenuis]|uniref:Nucleotide exchange factor SIL1 n=1 Tax=Nesidiocoris tenuis TaxID=355587 RepID=A0ABN7AZ35_9HEMI|nr:Nucleotide exchange factor [Nesidiocoris tenuis]
MRQIVHLFVISIILSLSIVLKGSNDEDKGKQEDDGVFKPTSDWQPLRKDQAIPRGLHVRMNLQTGEREAKLLDLEEEDINRQRRMTEIIASEPPSPAPDYRPPEPDEPVKFDKSELKQALHKMEDDFTGESENVARVRKQFRSYSELKKELGEIKLNMKTDLEVLGQLIDDYRQTIDRRSGGAVDKKEHELEESLLSQMEYLVHQYDNAIDFVKRDGIKEIVFPSLNSTSWKVRYESTKLLGSAVQSNPKAQIAALEAGVIPVLLRVLALDSHVKVKSGGLFALSCLIRRFPVAQKQFLDRGGLTVIVKQFKSDTSGQLKIQLKAINLLRDIVEEMREAELDLRIAAEDAPDRAVVAERHRQQRQLNLWTRIVEEGWCQALTTLLSRHSEDLQVVEVLSDGMASVANECAPVFKSSEETIEQLAKVYDELVAGSTADYQWVRSNLQKLLTVSRRKEKDEL